MSARDERHPARVRLWVWWHQRHGWVAVIARISTPAWDPGAKGILARCECGKVGAW